MEALKTTLNALWVLQGKHGCCPSVDTFFANCLLLWMLWIFLPLHILCAWQTIWNQLGGTWFCQALLTKSSPDHLFVCIWARMRFVVISLAELKMQAEIDVTSERNSHEIIEISSIFFLRGFGLLTVTGTIFWTRSICIYSSAFVLITIGSSNPNIRKFYASMIFYMSEGSCNTLNIMTLVWEKKKIYTVSTYTVLSWTQTQTVNCYKCSRICVVWAHSLYVQYFSVN